MLQPFLPEICEKGEWSLMFLNNEFTHSVLKMPQRGDFRVQQSCGGTLRNIDASSSIVNKARDVMGNLDKKTLYARVDGVEIEGEFVLTELELIEPSLYLVDNNEAKILLANSIADVVYGEQL